MQEDTMKGAVNGSDSPVREKAGTDTVTSPMSPRWAACLVKHIVMFLCRSCHLLSLC